MIGALPLLAVDIGLIIGIAIMIIAVIGQILTKLREAQQQQPRPGGQPAPRPASQQQRPPAPRPQQPQPQKPQPAAGQNPLEEEIRRFLRNATARREAGRPETQPRTPPPARPQPATVPAPVEAEVLPGVGGLRRQLESEKHRELVSQDLGEDVSSAEKEILSHVQEVFSHHVGTLSDVSASAGDVGRLPPLEPDQRAILALPSTAAVGLAAMFATTENLRTAILVNEVLQRPEHRWV